MWQLQYRKTGDQDWRNISERVYPIMETAADKKNALKLLRINDDNLNGGANEFRAVRI